MSGHVTSQSYLQDYGGRAGWKRGHWCQVTSRHSLTSRTMEAGPVGRGDTMVSRHVTSQSHFQDYGGPAGWKRGHWCQVTSQHSLTSRTHQCGKTQERSATQSPLLPPPPPGSPSLVGQSNRSGVPRAPVSNAARGVCDLVHAAPRCGDLDSRRNNCLPCLHTCRSASLAYRTASLDKWLRRSPRERKIRGSNPA